MAKPNFQFEKRRKELERKRKNDEKLQRKQARQIDPQQEESPIEAVQGQDTNSDGDTGDTLL